MMSSNSGMKSFISKDFLGLAVIFFVILNNQHVESTRIARAVMMSVAFPINLNCTDSTIMRKNSTSNVILTGTVANCYNRRAGSYKCRLQVCGNKFFRFNSNFGVGVLDLLQFHLQKFSFFNN